MYLATPFETEKSLKKGQKIIEEFDIKKMLYPPKIMDPVFDNMMSEEGYGRVQPPKCVFVPSVRLIRRVAKAILQYGATDTNQ